MEFISLLPEDIPLVQKLAETIWRENYSEMISSLQIDYMLNLMYSEKTILQNLQQNENWYIVYQDQKAIGYLHFFLKEQNLFLSKIYLKTEEQGKGYATEMLDFVIQKAKLSKAKCIELTVNKNNPKAISFYEKSGFVKKNEVVFDIGNGYVMDDFIMHFTC